MKTIWKNKASRIWLIVTSAILVLMLTVYIVAIHVPLIYGTIKLALGEDRFAAVGEASIVFPSDHETKEASLEASNALNAAIVEEGIILMKNEGNALPLNISTEKRISVFGKNSVNLVYGGSGSGKKDTSKVVDLYKSLSDAGFEYNPTLKSLYDDNSKSDNKGRPESPAMGTVPSGFPIGETPINMYTSDIKASYASDYNAAALVVISRIGGEGYDLPRTMKMSAGGVFVDNAGWAGTTKITGAKSTDSHYLELDQYETDMLNEVCGSFNKVILIINCSTSMELGFLEDGTFPNLKAALWIGNPGGKGASAIGKILKGDANPSGRTVDTYAKDFTLDPTWANFSNNLTYKGNQYKVNNTATDAYFVRYSESIYVGYRYYETRGYDETQRPGGDSAWYSKNVVFPFGYGLSYTSFSWDVIEQTPAADATLTKDGTITVKVRVTNTGTVAGKDVVQLYYSAPYFEGGIEKAHVVLGDFAKTDKIQPGAYYDATLTLKVSDMASYDWDDKNGNDFCGYELEGGAYKIFISKNAHEAVETIDYTVGDDYRYDKDTKTGTTIKNLFDDVSNHIKDEDQYMSRADFAGTMPTAPDAAYINRKTAFVTPFKDPVAITEADDAGKPWHTTTMPQTGVEGTVVLSDLTGKSYDDELWDSLLNRLTIDEMANLIGVGAFKTQYIKSIGKPETKDWDGPGGFVVGSFMKIGDSAVETCFYASECVIAATYNKELAYKMGIEVGNEGIIGAQEEDIQRTFSGWYAPAVNIHRSPFSGRNFEYYSEDGVLSGKMAAEVCKGAKVKGVYTYLKHFALNDQETDRSSNGLATWADEQTMREIYFKPFEIAVKEGGTTAIMSSFNRIGTEWAGSSYNLLTALLRKEWGFRGMVITDYNGPAYMNLDRMIRGGGDLNLFQSGAPSTSAKALTATQVSVMRQATKNILFAVANSNAMNMPDMRKMLPIWEIVMYCIFAAIIVGLGVWGFFVIRAAFKNDSGKAEESSPKKV